MSRRINTSGLKKILICLPVIFQYSLLLAQSIPYGNYDSLRGSLNPYRSFFDVTYYKLDLNIHPAEKYISGSMQMQAVLVSAPTDTIQLELDKPLEIKGILIDGRKTKFRRDSAFLFIKFPSQRLAKHDQFELKVFYGGHPRIAENPPWDGGFTFSEDSLGYALVSVACEGDGASLWWPNKDHLSDEPDSMKLNFTVPADLRAISNGRLIDSSVLEDSVRYSWVASYPINNYNATVYVGNYQKITDHYHDLELVYYVLGGNKEIASDHFKQVKPMLACFEKYFGEYPFKRDSYKLVETNYWGMEHQSAIAYGNNYRNNPFGFDFIIIHESGHEWFGNSVSVADHADMWIHEAFTTYAEMLYLECTQSDSVAMGWINSQRKKILNAVALQGPKGVNYTDWPGADIYYKGSWMLHGLRNKIGNDSLWFSCLKSFVSKFQLSITSTNEVIKFFSKCLGNNLTPYFKAYLNYSQPPVLEVKQGKEENWEYRWKTPEAEFEMPVILQNGEGYNVSTEWQTLAINPSELNRNSAYYKLKIKF